MVRGDPKDIFQGAIRYDLSVGINEVDVGSQSVEGTEALRFVIAVFFVQ